MLKETVIQKLLVLGRKILRRIFGPTKENQIWRNKTNEELHKLIKHKNIVNYLKAQRLSWLDHVQRMSDTRTVKKIFNWKPLTKRPQGRPKYRWEDNIKQDICQMKIKTGHLASRIERNGRRRSLRRPKRSAIKEISAPGRRRSDKEILLYTNLVIKANMSSSSTQLTSLQSK